MNDARQPAPIPALWSFFAAIPVSLLMAVVLTPMIGGQVEYLIAYGFLMICATMYLVSGVKRKKRGHVHISTALVFLAPVLPVVVASVYDAIQRL